MIHRSVLLHEAIDGLAIKPGMIVVDGTLGNGGHSEEMIKRFQDTIQIIAIDLDTDAIQRSTERLAPYKKNILYVQNNFRNIDTILGTYNISSVQAVLLDIGMSSNQLEESGRGFAFRSDEPLEMTFATKANHAGYTAYDVVNTWDEDSLRTIIKAYGEERFAGRIARGIVRTRELSPIVTTVDLVNVILGSTPRAYHHGRIHPATRTFQALRIVVNDELSALEDGIEKNFNLLSPGGRLAIISFRSLEDRIVKNHFKTIEASKKGIRITKKPIVPKEEEIIENPRSRSAKLRIIEKIQ